MHNIYIHNIYTSSNKYIHILVALLFFLRRAREAFWGDLVGKIDQTNSTWVRPEPDRKISQKARMNPYIHTFVRVFSRFLFKAWRNARERLNKCIHIYIYIHVVLSDIIQSIVASLLLIYTLANTAMPWPIIAQGRSQHTLGQDVWWDCTCTYICRCEGILSVPETCTWPKLGVHWTSCCNSAVFITSRTLVVNLHCFSRAQ